MAPAMSYCKHCGTNLRSLQRSDKPPEKTIDSLIWLIVGTTIVILGMCLGSLVLMADKAIDFKLGTAFVILSFAALVLVEAVLVWRVLRLSKGAKDTGGLIRGKDTDAVEQDAVRAHALREPDEPLPGVTEQTTRPFEASYRGDERR